MVQGLKDGGLAAAVALHIDFASRAFTGRHGLDQGVPLQGMPTSPAAD